VARDLARAREVHTPSDTELALRSADGDVDAFDELYRRHAQSAWRVAQAIAANAEDAADAVAEAFVHVFQALPAGRLTQGVPFRPYLLKATRNAAIDTLRRGQRVQPTGEIGRLDETATSAGPSEHLVISEEVSLVADAFRSLPERWRSVLWLTEVEGLPARDVALMLGMSANGVAQLALRARAGLRRNYLQAHVRNGVSPGCRATVDRLGALVAGALPRREIVKVERHLDGCEECQARLADLEDVGSTLRRGVLPMPLAAGAVAARTWRAFVAASTRPKSRLTGRLVSSAGRRALSGATAVVLGLGVAAVLVGPHAGDRAPSLTVRAPVVAPAAQATITLAGAASGASGASTDAASTPSEAGTTTTDAPAAGHVPPASAGRPPPPIPPAPRPPAQARPTPVVQVGASVVLGAARLGVAVGIGPGACTALALEPSAGGCIDPARSTTGITAQAAGSLVPGLRLPLP
jgi:RNA polymerase sigma factor (sigma-70 family)